MRIIAAEQFGTSGLKRFAAGLASLAILAAAGIPLAAEAATGPQISVTPASLAFGNQAVGTTSAAQALTVKNTGSTGSSLSFTSISLTGSGAANYTLVNGCTAALPAGTSCTIGVSFAPAALGTLGAKAGDVTIVSNSNTTKTDTIKLTGTATAAVLTSIALSPLSAELQVGDTQQLTVIGTYSSGKQVALATSGETFTSLSTGVATVSTTGLVTVNSKAAVGSTATITAKNTATGIGTATGSSTLVTVVPRDGNVYTKGAFDTGVTFVPFGGSTNSPLPAPDPSTLFTDGTDALKIAITATGSYSGGAFVAPYPRDMRKYNGLTFWAKASQDQNTLKVQIGNDGGAGKNVNFQVESIGIPLTTSWQQYFIPMPDPKRSNGLDGLFSFADGPNNYTVWLAGIQYIAAPTTVYGSGTTTGDGLTAVTLSSTTTPPSYLLPKGSSLPLNPATNNITWTLGTGMLNGSPVVPLPAGGVLDNVAWVWFALTPSNADAKVTTNGVITGAAAGAVNLAATLAGTAIPGSPLPITVTAPAPTPKTAAPTPTQPAANVVAIYDSTGTYTPIAANLNENWCGGTTVNSFPIPGTNPVENVLQYVITNTCTGIGFEADPINATALNITSFHVDLWAGTATSAQLQIVDNGGGVGIYNVTIPAGVWTSVDQLISAFPGLSSVTAIQQVGIVGVPLGAPPIYVDNLYFYGTGGGGGPTSPTAYNTLAGSPVSVIALFDSSARYAEHPVDTFVSTWSPANSLVAATAPYTLIGTSVNGTNAGASGALEYTLSGYAGIVFGDGEYGGTTNTVDATGMAAFHIEVWTATAADFQIELVNDAASGAGCGVAPESCATVDAGTLTAGKWNVLDIPMSTFTAAGLTSVTQIQQLLLLASGTFWIDNIAFHSSP